MKIPKSSSGDSQTSLNNNPPKPVDYEPTSVLDPHITSSPLCPPTSLPWDSTPFPLPLTSSFSDDWPDPVSFLLTDMDDNSCSFFPDLSLPTPPPPEAANSHIDLLLRAAHAIEIGDFNSALSILARLNFLLPCPTGAPLHRAAFHFKDALLSLLPIPDRPIPEPSLSAVELVRRITAHKAFSDLSPIPQFISFTANQTLLESLDAGTSSLHLIDFDLGLGGQWSSFAHDLAARSRAARLPPPALRITAVVADETAETALAADNLHDFGRGIGLRLTVEIVRIGGLGGVRFCGGEAVGVVLTPAVFRLIGVSVLRFVRRAAARVVLVVDGEGYCGGGSFRRRFVGGLEYFAAVMEVVDVSAAVVGAGEEAVRRIEKALFRPRIFTAVAAAATVTGDWREVMANGGMVAAELSEFTESQAEWLLRRAPVEGFHVARREGALMLSWKGRELCATSAWRCHL